MVPNSAMVLNQEALMIFAIIHEFLCSTDADKRNAALESFPQSFIIIPWRRVYKPLAEAQSGATAAYPAMEHWEPSELPFGGAGSFWCFTVLLRVGENVSRKTEDGQTWSSRSGRGPKNGFPDQIRVDKLVISGKAFHMLELTLNQDKPMVALCKIWRKGNSAAASPQATNPSIFSPEASTSQLQVLEDHFLIHEGMQIDQPQGQLEGTAQQYHMSDHAASTIGNIVLPDSSGGCVRSTGPNDDSTTYQTLFQDAVSFLHKMTGPFKQICISRRDRARKIALEAQNVKSSLENELNSLGINAEPESTMACTSNSTQLLVEPASTAGANTAALAPATTAQDEFPDQQLWSRSMEESYIDVGTYLNLDGGNNGTNLFDPDEAM